MLVAGQHRDLGVRDALLVDAVHPHRDTRFRRDERVARGADVRHRAQAVAARAVGDRARHLGRMRGASSGISLITIFTASCVLRDPVDRVVRLLHRSTATATRGATYQPIHQGANSRTSGSGDLGRG